MFDFCERPVGSKPLRGIPPSDPRSGYYIDRAEPAFRQTVTSATSEIFGFRILRPVRAGARACHGVLDET